MSTTSSNQSSYGSAAITERLGPWQEKLQEYCTAQGYRAPVYSIASDRRGGRTAWSATVDVIGQTIPARYWYDGQFVHNAKEDAACVAVERFTQVGSPYQQVPSGQGLQQSQHQIQQFQQRQQQAQQQQQQQQQQLLQQQQQQNQQHQQPSLSGYTSR